jgi:CheY-like chemotaxis protein
VAHEGVIAGGLAILVAEDNDINALLAAKLLKVLGHTSMVVSNGGAAVAVFAAAHAAGTPFDLVLMDLHMPDIDGIEATRLIRASEQRAGMPRTPIIALTADTVAATGVAGVAAGIDGFLVKPLDRASLAAALRKGGYCQAA